MIEGKKGIHEKGFRDFLKEVEPIRSREPLAEMLGAFKEGEGSLEYTFILVEAESHHQREEDTLFPKLREHDIVEPPEIMKMDHVEFRKRKQELYKLSHNSEDYDFKEFKENVIELGEYLTRELESHIFKEDNILYQIALQVLSDDEWDEVKKKADKIGYCCFTPEDQKKGIEV